MADLTLHELKVADQKGLDDLLRQEANRMFGLASHANDSLPRKDRQTKIQKGILTLLAPFRRLLRTS